MRRIAPPPLRMRAYVWDGKVESGSPDCRAMYDQGYVHRGAQR